MYIHTSKYRKNSLFCNKKQTTQSSEMEGGGPKGKDINRYFPKGNKRVAPQTQEKMVNIDYYLRNVNPMSCHLHR